MIFHRPAEGEQRTLVEQIDIVSQIEDAKCVPATMTLNSVYEDFRAHGREFAGVVEEGRLVGIVSRELLSHCRRILEKKPAACAG